MRFTIYHQRILSDNSFKLKDDALSFFFHKPLHQLKQMILERLELISFSDGLVSSKYIYLTYKFNFNRLFEIIPMMSRATTAADGIVMAIVRFNRIE